MDPFEHLLQNLVGLHRVTNGLNAQQNALYEALIDDLVGDLARIDPASGRGLIRRLTKVEQFMRPARGLVGEHLDEAYRILREDLVELGIVQSEWALEHLELMVSAGGGRALGAGKLLSAAEVQRTVDVRPLFGHTLADWSERQKASTLAKLDGVVKRGIMRGESIDEITSRVRGEVLGGATRGNEAIVRTAVNQISNQAHVQTLSQLDDAVTEMYEYEATLDSRTTPICASLDGKRFRYDDETAPRPPQHVNCRSNISPVINWKALGLKPPPPGERFARDPMTGMRVTVPGDLTYESWLRKQVPEVQSRVLGVKGATRFRNGESLGRVVRADLGTLTVDQVGDFVMLERRVLTPAQKAAKAARAQARRARRAGLTTPPAPARVAPSPPPPPPPPPPPAVPVRTPNVPRPFAPRLTAAELRRVEMKVQSLSEDGSIEIAKVPRVRVDEDEFLPMVDPLRLKFEIDDIDLDKIIVAGDSQSGVQTDRVLEYIRGQVRFSPGEIDVGSELPADLPVLFPLDDGRFMVLEGHHRLVAAALANETKMQAHVVIRPKKLGASVPKVTGGPPKVGPTPRTNKGEYDRTVEGLREIFSKPVRPFQEMQSEMNGPSAFNHFNRVSVQVNQAMRYANGSLDNYDQLKLAKETTRKIRNGLNRLDRYPAAYRGLDQRGLVPSQFSGLLSDEGDELYYIRTWLHENLHAKSAMARDRDGRLYNLEIHRFIEEGLVEYTARNMVRDVFELAVDVSAMPGTYAHEFHFIRRINDVFGDEFRLKLLYETGVRNRMPVILDQLEDHLKRRGLLKDDEARALVRKISGSGPFRHANLLTALEEIHLRNFDVNAPTPFIDSFKKKVVAPSRVAPRRPPPAPSPRPTPTPGGLSKEEAARIAKRERARKRREQRRLGLRDEIVSMADASERRFNRSIADFMNRAHLSPDSPSHLRPSTIREMQDALAWALGTKDRITRIVAPSNSMTNYRMMGFFDPIKGEVHLSGNTASNLLKFIRGVRENPARYARLDPPLTPEEIHRDLHAMHMLVHENLHALSSMRTFSEDWLYRTGTGKALEEALVEKLAWDFTRGSFRVQQNLGEAGIYRSLVNFSDDYQAVFGRSALLDLFYDVPPSRRPTVIRSLIINRIEIENLQNDPTFSVYLQALRGSGESADDFATMRDALEELADHLLGLNR